ncbi:MAG: hypothetical protein ACOVNZ_04990 [Crocinitomicaceae bacterium]
MKNIVVVILLFALVSCSKEKRINQRLNGNWKINLVSIEDSEGFYFEDTSAKGSINFSFEDSISSGMISYKFINSVGTTILDTLKLDSIYYQLNLDENRLYMNQNLLNFRILLLTKSDLQLEYYDQANYRLKRFVLVKQ